MRRSYLWHNVVCLVAWVRACAGRAAVTPAGRLAGLPAGRGGERREPAGRGRNSAQVRRARVLARAGGGFLCIEHPCDGRKRRRQPAYGPRLDR